jgi:SAM-dependent methyltransferase
VTIPGASGRLDGTYWDGVLAGWQRTLAHRLWRAHSDAVNIRLLRRWLPSGCGRLLKTDLFDEAVASGLYTELVRRAEEVIGVDLSCAAIRAARERYPNLDARAGSVLALPFPDASFDVVVSNSTLDHFERRAMLRHAIGELARVIRPGGELIITLDNRLNPLIAVRTSRALASLHRQLGIVPYYVGVTCGARGLSTLLRACGFRVQDITAIMHCPPQLAAEIAQRAWRGHAGAEAEKRYVRRVLRWERMERWPTRHLTGHFVAARGIRA